MILSDSNSDGTSDDEYEDGADGRPVVGSAEACSAAELAELQQTVMKQLVLNYLTEQAHIHDRAAAFARQFLLSRWSQEQVERLQQQKEEGEAEAEAEDGTRVGSRRALARRKVRQIDVTLALKHYSAQWQLPDENLHHALARWSSPRARRGPASRSPARGPARCSVAGRSHMAFCVPAQATVGPASTTRLCRSLASTRWAHAPARRHRACPLASLVLMLVVCAAFGQAFVPGPTRNAAEYCVCAWSVQDLISSGGEGP